MLKDKTEEISMMNQYVVSPARLTVKDGKKYVAMTLKIVTGLRNSKQKIMVDLQMQK